MMMESLAVTVASPPPAPSRTPPNPAMLPVREDRWAEDATFTLIDAWGDRYLELNRGNLRQKHWEEVADAVNRLHGHVRRRTDMQCKNRIDTLKKKYKIEKSRVLESDDDVDGAGGGGGGGYKSDWPFFEPLDKLVGSTLPAKKPSPPATGTLSPAWTFNSPIPVGPRSSKRPAPNLSPPAIGTPSFTAPEPVGLRPSKRPAKQWSQPLPLVVDDSQFQRRFSALAAAAAAEEEDPEEEEAEEEDEESGLRREKKESKEEEQGYRAVAMAIERLGEIYMRVESKKQQCMLELEKQRMQFLKDLEIQRMQLFVETQLQLQKIKPIKNKKPTCTSKW